MEKIIAVYGKAQRRLFLVRWANYPGQDSWQKEHSLLQDGRKDVIDDFWIRSGLNPAADFFPDKEGRPRCWMCGWASKSMDPRYLKSHIKRKGHKWEKTRAQRQARRDIHLDKLELQQLQRPHVQWGDLKVQNCWRTEYLGSIFQAGGDHIPDVRQRIAKAKSRAGRLRHILQSPLLELDFRLRLYILGCCSILTYGSEAWTLDERTCKIINGANAFMLSHITGKSRHEESSYNTSSFNILLWIRSRRLKWLGHILRMDDSRLVKQAVKQIHTHRRQGDLLMDTDSELSWEALLTKASDRDEWRQTVRQMSFKARGILWDESRARVKRRRREERSPPVPNPQSNFRYKASINLVSPPQPLPYNKVKAKRIQLAHVEFALGSAQDRANLRKQASRTKKLLKEKEKRNKGKHLSTTANTTPRQPIQTDIRTYLTHTNTHHRHIDTIHIRQMTSGQCQLT